MNCICAVPLKQLGWISCISLKEKSTCCNTCEVKLSKQIFCNLEDVQVNENKL